MEIYNSTPYEVERYVHLSETAEEILVVVVKATFDLKASPPRLSEKQRPIQFGDEYHGEPGRSSIKMAGETASFKPAADVVLIGHAYTQEKDHTQVDVRLRVGDFEKTVRVFGDRHWEETLFSAKPSEPKPFEKTPLVWERAFGGTDASVEDAVELEQRNPVGIGFRSKKSKAPIVDAPLPNLENPSQLIRKPNDKPEPCGFGFVSPHWLPRVTHAGTYDDAWMEKSAPFLPDDFDPKFHQVAPPDQVFPEGIAPGTPVEVDNASPSGRLSFAIPEVPMSVVLYRRFMDSIEMQMKMDTVIIDGDAEQLMLISRGNVSVHNQLYDISEIFITQEAAVLA